MAFVKAVNQLSEAYYLNHVGYKDISDAGKKIGEISHVLSEPCGI